MFSELKHRFDGKGKRAVALFATMALLCGFTGCKKEEVEGSSNSVVSTSKDVSISNFESTTTSTLETTGKFDWDKAMSDFYIDDIKMKYPFSESVLGEKFIFNVDEARYTSGDEYGDGWLTIVVDHKDHTSWWIFEARYNGVTKETYKPDLAPDKIYSIPEPVIQGIKEGTLMEDVYALWGKPDETEETVISSPRTKVYYYGKEDGQRLCLRYDNTTNKVESIEIYFRNMN